MLTAEKYQLLTLFCHHHVSRSQIRSIFPHKKTATGVKWLEFMFHMLAKLNSLILPVFSVYFAFISYGTVILNIMCECNSLLI